MNAFFVINEFYILFFYDNAMNGERMIVWSKALNYFQKQINLHENYLSRYHVFDTKKIV